MLVEEGRCALDSAGETGFELRQIISCIAAMYHCVAVGAQHHEIRDRRFRLAIQLRDGPDMVDLNVIITQRTVCLTEGESTKLAEQATMFCLESRFGLLRQACITLSCLVHSNQNSPFGGGGLFVPRLGRIAGFPELGQSDKPGIGDLHHSHVRLDGGEGMLFNLSPGLSQGVEDGRLARVGKSDYAYFHL